MNPRRWDDALVHCRTRREPCVLVTVLGTSGSAPRDPGAKMVVTAAQTFDSIGGGRLEWLVIEGARALLASGEGADQKVEHFPLGQAAGQCCGGAVAVLLERIEPVGAGLALFGAGHVARALITVLAELPFQVTWIDSRPEQFAEVTASNVEPLTREDPVAWVPELPPAVPALVMTHDHALDLALVSALLGRTEPGPVGLIGSDIKAQRFRMRLAAMGHDETALARLRCPVGLPGIAGKEPMAIAVSIAAELLGAGPATERAHAADPDAVRRPLAGRQAGLPWRELRALLADHEE